MKPRRMLRFTIALAAPARPPAPPRGRPRKPRRSTRGDDVHGRPVVPQRRRSARRTSSTPTRPATSTSARRRTAPRRGDTETNGCRPNRCPRHADLLRRTRQRRGQERDDDRHARLQLVDHDAESRRERRRHVRYNDLALIKIDALAGGNVNPTVPFWGGPTGSRRASRAPANGLHLRQLDPARRRQRAEPEDRREPRRQEGTEGWSEELYTATPGHPRRLRQRLMNASGDALGVLSTVEFAPVPAANGVGTLAKELAYANARPASASRSRPARRRSAPYPYRPPSNDSTRKASLASGGARLLRASARRPIAERAVRAT